MFKEDGAPKLAELVACGIELYRSITMCADLFLARYYKVVKRICAGTGGTPIIEQTPDLVQRERLKVNPFLRANLPGYL